MVSLRRRGATPHDPLERARRTGRYVTSHEWVWPWWLERQSRPSHAAHVPMGELGLVENVTGRDWVVLGTVTGSAGVVDPAGLVSTAAGWSLDWWIGADDRWHLPSREATRQTAVGSVPIVETLLRIPGGDAVHRAYATPGPGGVPVVVVEIENRSPVPFAVALAVRPVDLEGAGQLGRIEIDAAGATVDGRRELSWSRPPSRGAAGSSELGDVRNVVESGAAAEGPVAASCDDGMATAAAVWPLPHTATLRVVVGAGLTAEEVERLPTANDVADGWATLRDHGVALDVPDRNIVDALTMAHATLVVDAAGARRHPLPEALDIAVGLAHAGQAGLAEQTFLELVGPFDPVMNSDAAAIVAAAAALWRLDRSTAVADARVGPLTIAAHAGAKTCDPADLRSLAAAMRVVEQPEVADDLDGLADDRGAPSADETSSRGSSATLATVAETAALGRLRGVWPTLAHPRLGAGSRGSGNDALKAASFAEAVVAALVDVDVATGTIDVLTDFPGDWLGHPVELHRLPTELGRVSVAVRWHGLRPALLWEVDLHEDAGPVRLRVPGLDPSWSTTDLSGEALLETPPDMTVSGESFG